MGKLQSARVNPFVFIVLFALGVFKAAFAQAILADPSSELRRQDRQRQELRDRMETPTWSPSGLITQTPQYQQLPDEQPCALIDRVLIRGALFSEALQTALGGVRGDDPPYGRCLGSQAVTLLIQRVQQALVEQGYITSHVHVPEQDLNNGELVLQVKEGRIAHIRLESNEAAKTPLPRLVWAVGQGRILNLRDIEQSSDNLQRLPSLKSNIQIEPGEAQGTSDLVVNIQATRPLRVGWSVDDGGLKTTGKLQGNATLSWDNPLGLGDLFYLTKGQDLGDKDNEINTYGTQFSATRNLTLAGGDKISYFAVKDQALETARRDSRTGWGIGNLFSIKVGSDSTTNSTFKLSGQPTVLQSQGDILSNSGGDQLLQGTKVSYGGTAAFNGSVGEKARADARIILEGIKNSTTQTRTSQSNYVVWQTMVNSGTKTETLVLPTFTGPTKPTLIAPGGLSVQIPEGNFKTQISTLSQQPGMSYLNDLAARTDVNWQPVKLAHDSWNYQQSGLTPAGAALLSVAVAWATGGAGSNLLGTSGAATSAMANAAFSSLAAQASIILINNKGDVGMSCSSRLALALRN